MSTDGAERQQRGSFTGGGAGLEPSREQPGKQGGLSGALHRGLNFTGFLGFCSSDIQSEISVHSLDILEAIEEKKYYMECCFA